MISSITVIFLLTIHWIADFILQTDEMAKNKSSSNYYLGIHILYYTIPFLIIFGIKFALVNGIAHFLTDYVTSRITSKLYAKGDVHNFFVVIGFDQLIHSTTLILSYIYFFGN